MQVKNAVIVHNTFVNNAHNIVIGVMGSDNTASLPPLNCTIANNLVYAKKGKILEERFPPAGMTYLGNIFSELRGSIISSSMDHRTEQFEMIRDSDGLFRPETASVVIRAGRGVFPFVTDDMDGQIRTGRKDVGADQIRNESIKYHPLRPEDVGPQWRSRIEKGKR